MYPGCTWTESISCASRNFSSNEKRRKRSGQFPHQLILELLHQLTEILPFQRSIGNPARMVFAVAEYPRFADRAVVR